MAGVAKMVRTHADLEVYRKAFAAAMEIFTTTEKFPKKEAYSLTDQIGRSSRSVCANMAEARRKRRYRAALVSKLSDCESEAAETQVWIEFAVKCGYFDRKYAVALYRSYDDVLRMLVAMINNPDRWVLKPK